MQAGIDPPGGPERVAAHVLTHVVGADGTRAVTLVAPTVAADIALLCRRLRTGAADAGAEVVDDADLLDVEVERGRIVAVAVAVDGARAGADAAARTRPPRRLRLEAPLFVDASGRGGVSSR